jgi:hypothetical protein
MKAANAVMAISIVLGVSGASMAQEGGLQADLRREGQELSSSCDALNPKALAGCAQVLFTGKPLHIAVESFAPGNGVGFGLGFHEEHNTARWRFSVDSVADASVNASWRAGVYGKAVLTGKKKIIVVTETTDTTPAPAAALDLRRPTFNFLAETITLNQLAFYGLGPLTAKTDRTFYGMDHRYVGANAVIPLRFGFSVMGELAGRWFGARGRHGQNSPSIEEAFSAATAPGLGGVEGFLQTGEGVGFDHGFGRRLEVSYSAKLQQFHATDVSAFSFRRFTADGNHRFPWLRTRTAKNGNKTTDEVGSISLGGTLIESIAGAGHVVPFYLQPTLGGTDINHARRLSSYPDYRFRAPNLWLSRATVEHIIKGPLGVIGWAEAGKVALRRDDLDFTHVRHSFAVGLTAKAGNFPFLSFVFSWGGTEGTHTIVDVQGLGPAKGPSLY